MVEVVWTDFAIQDLSNIGEFIARDSERYAKDVIQTLFDSTLLLESHPKAGRVVPEFHNKNIRELVRIRYRIVYRVVDDYRIDILTIHHSARQMSRLTLEKRRKQ